jgi:hypothetical protein
VRLIEACDRLLEVKNMDTIAGGEDERAHLRIPTAGLVSKVYTRLE